MCLVKKFVVFIPQNTTYTYKNWCTDGSIIIIVGIGEEQLYLKLGLKYKDIHVVSATQHINNNISLRLGIGHCF